MLILVMFEVNLTGSYMNLLISTLNSFILHITAFNFFTGYEFDKVSLLFSYTDLIVDLAELYAVLLVVFFLLNSSLLTSVYAFSSTFVFYIKNLTYSTLNTITNPDLFKKNTTPLSAYLVPFFLENY